MRNTVVLLMLAVGAMIGSGCGASHGGDVAAGLGAGMSGVSSGLSGSLSQTSLRDSDIEQVLRGDSVNHLDEVFRAGQAVQAMVARELPKHVDRVMALHPNAVNTSGTFCDFIASVPTAAAGFTTQGSGTTATTGEFTVKLACDTGKTTVTITVTMAKTITATACGATYTLNSGLALSLGIPNFQFSSASTALTNGTWSLGINGTMSGGNLKSGGSAVACNFSFSYQTFIANPTCTGLSSYTCTADGSTVACADWETATKSCSKSTLN